MNKVSIIISNMLCVCVCSNAIAQNQKAQNHCSNLPMRSGNIEYSTQASGVQHANSFIVSSGNNDVYALTKGKVALVVKFPGKDYQAVGVEYTADTLIEYSLLADVALKKGAIVHKGDLIGKAIKNQETGKNVASIEIKLPHVAMTKLTNDKVMSFIKRFDN